MKTTDFAYYLSSLFAYTPKGAKANAVLYTIVENVRPNELVVYKYLKYLLEDTKQITTFSIRKLWTDIFHSRKNCRISSG